MKSLRLALVCLFLAASMPFWLVRSPAQAPAGKAGELAASVHEVLRQHCFDCHGKDDKNPKGDLKILDHTLLMKDDRHIVVKGSPEKSKLIEVIEDGSMPSGKRPKVPEAQLKVLRDWILAGAPSFEAAVATTRPAPVSDEKVVERVTAVFKKHCVECHGATKARAGLEILEFKRLVQDTVVVPRNPEQSVLYTRITATDESVMPPPKKPRMAKDEIAAVHAWIAAGAPEAVDKTLANKLTQPAPATVANVKPATPIVPPDRPATPALPVVPQGEATSVAGEVKQIFKENCYQCHGGGQQKAGLNILDLENLIRKKKVQPGNAAASRIYELITTDGEDQMPPGRLKLKDDLIRTIEQWILSGAPPFPEDLRVDPRYVGEEYILSQILAHVRKVPDVESRRYLRFFSINHTLGGGASQEDLDNERDALVLAINHLSWQRRLVELQPVDAIPVAAGAPAGTVLNTLFCVDIRELGWDRQPFDRVRDGRIVGPSTVNLFDLALLDYPYGLMLESSQNYSLVLGEFLQYASQVRPVPYVRADWFVSMATQPPLYEDFLLLPFDLPKLERILGVDAEANRQNFRAKRAGMTVSGVSRNNRVVERHPASRTAYYWLSYDFRTSRGRENMFKNPIHLNQTGGEVVFALPNGLNGYYVCDAKGARIEAAPTDIVVDEHAADRTVRNGLACMRCHEKGLKSISDDVRPALLKLRDRPGFDKYQALQIYPEIGDLLKDWQDDQNQFMASVRRLLQNRMNGGRPSDPLIKVSQRFLDSDLRVPRVTAELGLQDPKELEYAVRNSRLVATGLFQLAAGGQVRRDMWEDYFDQVVSEMGLGRCILPLDGLNRTDYQTNSLLDVSVKTNKRVYAAGDKLEITVTNNSTKDICIELIGTSAQGEKGILVPSPYWIKAGQKYVYRHPQPITPSVGRELITLYACDAEFPPGEVLQIRNSKEYRDMALTDRVLHSFYALNRAGGRTGLTFDPARMVKHTIEIATQ